MDITEGGTFPVLPSIFNERGGVDERGFAAVVEATISAGVAGLVFPGLASEYDQLSLEERSLLLKILVAVNAGRVPIVVGASGSSDAETAAMLEQGARHKTAAAMIMTPARLAGDMDGLVKFFEWASQYGVPTMLQNAPQPMGSGLSTSQVLGLTRRVHSIAYIKEENLPCGQRVTEILANAPSNLLGVFGGAGGRYILDELQRGATGTMPAAELPAVSVALVSAFRRGDLDSAREIHERLLPILMMQAVFRWDLTKAILRRRGLIDSVYVRAAGPRMDRHDRSELNEQLARMDALVPRQMAAVPS